MVRRSKLTSRLTDEGNERTRFSSRRGDDYWPPSSTEAAAMLRFGTRGRVPSSFNGWHLACVNGDEKGFIFTASCTQDSIVITRLPLAPEQKQRSQISDSTDSSNLDRIGYIYGLYLLRGNYVKVRHLF